MVAKAQDSKSSEKLTARFYNCTQLQDLLGVSRHLLVFYCASGMIPHARLLGSDWIIEKAGAVFIRNWLKYREDMGSLWKRTVCRSAGKHDPACVVRQQNSKGKASETELDLKDVLTIRKRCDSGEPCADVAADYGLDQSTVWYIWSGRSYPLPANFKPPRL